MTPEEIKKIAEEYGNHRSSLDKQLSAIFATDGHNFLTWLTERYFVVEKSKVKQERRYYEVTEWVDGDSISDLMGDIKDTFKQLFGPDIRKEEEE